MSWTPMSKWTTEDTKEWMYFRSHDEIGRPKAISDN